MLITKKEDLVRIFTDSTQTGKARNLICITHSGVFHADEVFCMAFFKLFEDYFRLEADNSMMKLRFAHVLYTRVSDPSKFYVAGDDDYIIFDIGRGEFDHHQEGSAVRDTSTDEDPQPYAAFGLIWREFAPIVFDEKFVAEFDEKFVKPIDLQDNGISLNPISGTITRMNPGWDSHDSADKRFEAAVRFAMDVLKTWFDAYFSNRRANHGLEAAMRAPREHQNILVLNRYMPYFNYLTQQDPQVIEYVVYPSARNAGEWCIAPVNSKVLLLPEAWVHESVDGMTFCHKARFIASFKSAEAAIAAITAAEN